MTPSRKPLRIALPSSPHFPAEVILRAMVRSWFAPVGCRILSRAREHVIPVRFPMRGKHHASSTLIRDTDAGGKSKTKPLSRILIDWLRETTPWGLSKVLRERRSPPVPVSTVAVADFAVEG